MAIDRNLLKGIYARLKGIERSLPASGNLRSFAARDFNSLVQQLTSVLEEDTTSFLCPPTAFFAGGGNSEFCLLEALRPKLAQVIEYIDYMHHISNNVIEIGSIYNSIQDVELRDRCADLLSAPGNFDRVINQATQVLEDRIRRKAQRDNNLTGVQLINDVLKADPAQTVIRVSEDEGEQRGAADICRGMMSAFRNPTHHQITDRFSREAALKVCAFVDNLLLLIDGATVFARR